MEQRTKCFGFPYRVLARNMSNGKARLLKACASKFRDKKEKELIEKIIINFIFYATVKSQVANDKGLSHPHCLIETGATVHLQQAPSHCFLNSFWDRSENISFCDISGRDVAKESCQHSKALSCLTLGAGAHELQILHR